MADGQTHPDKALTALEESRRELESLTYTVAHDLRAPLRTIEGFSRALSEDCAAELDADGRRYLQHVLDAAHRMSGMLEGLLSLARLQRAELHPIPLDLTSIASGIVDRLRAAEPARELELAMSGNIPAEGDSSLLTAALDALLQNAWKFTRGREPARIELGAQAATRPSTSCATTAWASTCATPTSSSTRSSGCTPNRSSKVSGSDWRRRGKSFAAMAGASGRRRPSAVARPFISRCENLREQPHEWEAPALSASRQQPSGHVAEYYLLYSPQHAQLSFDVRFRRFGVRAR